jgi:hypothetical protein
MQAVVNPLYPNRIQLQLSQGPDPTTGPLATAAGAGFDPRSNVELYLGGVATPINSFAFDAPNNQYLMFTSVAINTANVVQLVYHMATPPFLGSAGVLPGFAIVAIVQDVYDPVIPELAVSVPSATNPAYVFLNTTGGTNTSPIGWNDGGYGDGGFGGTGVSTGSTVVTTGWGDGGFGAGGFGGQTVVNGAAPPTTFEVYPVTGWNIGGYNEGGYGVGGIAPLQVEFYALGIAQVRIQCSTPVYDSGLIPATSLYGSIYIPNLVPGDYLTLTLAAYDAQGNLMTQNGVTMILTFNINIENVSSS